MTFNFLPLGTMSRYLYNARCFTGPILLGTRTSYPKYRCKFYLLFSSYMKVFYSLASVLNICLCQCIIVWNFIISLTVWIICNWSETKYTTSRFCCFHVACQFNSSIFFISMLTWFCWNNCMHITYVFKYVLFTFKIVLLVNLLRKFCLHYVRVRFYANLFCTDIALYIFV